LIFVLSVNITHRILNFRKKYLVFSNLSHYFKERYNFYKFILYLSQRSNIMVLKLFVFMTTIVSAGLCAQETGQVERPSKKTHVNDSKALSSPLLDITNERSAKENLASTPAPSDIKTLPTKDAQHQQKHVEISPTYPKHAIEDVYLAYGGPLSRGDWILTTRDTMRLLAQGARMGDPVSTLYLAHAFDQTVYVDQRRCRFAHKLYIKAFHALEEIALQPGHSLYSKAKCLLAWECDTSPLMNQCIHNRTEPYNAEKYLKNLDTLETRLLRSIDALKSRDETTTIDSFLSEEVLRTYPEIFLRAITFLNDSRYNYTEILEKAIQIYEHPAFVLKLADRYRYLYEEGGRVSFRDKSFSLYERAGKLGVGIAYREMVSFLIRYRSIYHTFDFEELKSQEDREKCKEWLISAKDLGFPEAFYNLAHFMQAEYRRTKKTNIQEENEAMCQMVVDYYKQAAQYDFLGYEMLEQVLDEDDEFFVLYPDLPKEKENLFNFAMGNNAEKKL
jgi:hypothetical protein